MYLFKIVSLVEELDVPPNLVLNLDQTHLKNISAARQSLANKETILVPIAGLTNKRSITGTFIISLSGYFFC